MPRRSLLSSICRKGSLACALAIALTSAAQGQAAEPPRPKPQVKLFATPRKYLGPDGFVSPQEKVSLWAKLGSMKQTIESALSPAVRELVAAKRALASSTAAAQLAELERIRPTLEGKGFGAEWERAIGALGARTAPGDFWTYDTAGEAFGRIFDLIAQAKSAQESGGEGFVSATSFSLPPDAVGLHFAAAARALARVGGDVHLVLEPTGTIMIDGAVIRNRLVALTPGLAKRELPAFWDKIAEPKGVSQKRVQITATRASALLEHLSHRKAVIVGIRQKGGPLEVHVLSGGLNITDYHLLVRDFEHEITGPAVLPSVDNQIAHWEYHAGEPLPVDLQARMRTPQVEREGMTPIGTLAHRGQEDINIQAFHIATLDALPAGGTYVLEVPYIYNPDLFAAMKRASARGARVVVVTPRVNDEAQIGEAFAAAAPDLIRSGVEVYFYDGSDPMGRKYRDGFSHAKMGVAFYRSEASLDATGQPTIERLGFSQTSNKDARSLKDNDEEAHYVRGDATATIANALVFDLGQSKRATLDAAGRLVIDGVATTEQGQVMDHIIAHFAGLL